MQIAYRVIKLLSDGKFHSGEILAKKLQVHRTTIHKSVHFLIANHIEIDCVKGRGYRWVSPVDLIQKQMIADHLSEMTKEKLPKIDLVAITPSTNDYLIQRRHLGLPSGSVCIAEGQSKGKGRMGRHWLSPFGANIYCSVFWHFDRDLHLLHGLSLIVAVAVIKAIEKLVYPSDELGIKWPNDVYFQNKKLAGILVECFTSKASQGCDVVIGIGLNVNMPLNNHAGVDYTTLQTFTDIPINRNTLVAYLLNALVEAIMCFESSGFVAFVEQCQRYDILLNKQISILNNNCTSEHGLGRGINERGELCYQAGQHLKAIRQGEVSIRFSGNIKQGASK